MAISHGRKAEFKIDDTGATLRDLSSYISGVDFPRDRDLADASTLGDDDRQFVSGLKGATFTIPGQHEPTIDGYLHALYEAGEPTDFEYYPQGNATGKVKITGQVLVNSYSTSTDLGGVGSFSLGLTVNGGVTRALVS